MSAVMAGVRRLWRRYRDAEGDGARLAKRVERRLRVALLAATFLGAIDVFALLWWVLPAPGYDVSKLTLFLVNAGTFAADMLLGAVVGLWLGGRVFRPVRRWLHEDRPPTESERRATIAAPLRISLVTALGWVQAAVLFFAVNAWISVDLAAHAAATIALGGVTCVALTYLLTDRLMRPVTARALAYGPAQAARRLGITGRLVVTWLFATGVPVLGLILLGLDMVISPEATTVTELARSMMIIAGATMFAGLAGTYLVARSVSDPLASLRRAMGRVESGDLEARVTVNDASEVGLLQSRFNTMAAGLAERERMRDLFGRHVGEEVAQEALDRDGEVTLGGEVRDVAVLFVDLCGSTSLAASRPPREVVRVLNDFFAVVVDVVERHGGWVNKFEGDAALAVFGAPSDHPDAAGAALAAARELRDRLAAMNLDAGIGVSAGPAVAGNVGAEQRFEYTVIGDPVNEAARLCELAKRDDERVLASGAILERARNGEEDHWKDRDEVVLRGRNEATRVSAPA